MKRVSIFLLAIFLSFYSFGQAQYQVLVEKTGEKTFKGLITRANLQEDTSFHWYTDNLRAYTPNAQTITNLKKQVDSVELMVFMGTWCEDSQFIIPKFFSLISASAFPEQKITMFGVDRKKSTTSHLAEALNVTNVPTIIVFKNGKEIGRVVEYGKHGVFDQDLGEILQ